MPVIPREDAPSRLLTAERVAARLARALARREGLAVVRLGDGEALCLAQETVLPINEVRARGPFLPYAGLTLPDLEARDRLARAILAADLVGVPTSEAPNYRPLLRAAFNAHRIDADRLTLTTSLVNYALQSQGHLARLLLPPPPRPRVLVVGNLAPRLAPILSAQGVEVSGSVAPVAGVRDVDRVLQAVSRQSFDLALVAAGIPAVLLCTAVAREMGKVALDFGHLADELVNGSKRLL